MKILEVAAHDKLKSGTPILMSRMSLFLHREGHDVTCVFCGESDDFSELRREGIDVDILPIARLKFKIQTVKNILKIRNYFKKNQFDVIHIHDSQALDNILLATLGMKLKIVVSRGFMTPLNYFNGLKYKLKKVKKIFVISNAVKERMQTSGKIKNDNKFIVFHGLLDNEVFNRKSNLREELKLKEKDFLIGIVSNESEIKGVDYLLSAFEEVSKKNPNICLVLAGISPNYVDLFIKEKSIKNKIFPLGFRKDIPNILLGIDTFVFTSRGEEALGLTIAEAQMAKKPVIVMKSGGSFEIVEEGQTGFVIDKGNIAALVEKIEYMHDNVIEREKMGAAAYKYASEKFGADNAIKFIERIYQQVVNEKR